MIFHPLGANNSTNSKSYQELIIMGQCGLETYSISKTSYVFVFVFSIRKEGSNPGSRPIEDGSKKGICTLFRR